MQIFLLITVIQVIVALVLARDIRYCMKRNAALSGRICALEDHDPDNGKIETYRAARKQMSVYAAIRIVLLACVFVTVQVLYNVSIGW